MGQVSGRGEEGCRKKRRNRGRREGEREERRVGRKMKEGVSVWGGFEEDPYAKGATGQTAQWAELWLKGDWSILAFPRITRAGSVQRGGRGEEGMYRESVGHVYFFRVVVVFFTGP